LEEISAKIDVGRKQIICQRKTSAPKSLKNEEKKPDDA
jgi:hypothetical protein